MKWTMVLTTIAVIFVTTGVFGQDTPNPDVKLAMHLVVSHDYLYCDDFLLTHPSEIDADLTVEELVASNYCGYIVFVAYDLGSCINCVEFFVTGWPLGRGSPVYSHPTYCDGEYAISLGEPFELFGGEGGLVCLGDCYWNPDTGMHSFAHVFFDLSGYSEYLPISVRYEPSSFSYSGNPHNYVISGPPSSVEDSVIEEYGCVIGIDGTGEEVDLVAPNGDEIWRVGSTPPIEWTYALVEDVRLEYSTDGGSSWQDIVSAAPGTGLYLWTVPDEPSTDCLVRISDAEDGVPSDVSEVPFTIASWSPHVIRVPSEWPSIQYGVYAAAPGDTVLVAPGVYHETVGMKDGVVVRSEAGASSTTIDAAGHYHGVVFSEPGTEAVISGFTITGGEAVGYSIWDMIGGGILFLEAGGTARNCVVTGNSASSLGGGIGCSWAWNVIVDGCLIYDNVALEVGGGVGLACGSAHITASDVVGNTAADAGGGIGVTNNGHGMVDHTIVVFNQASAGFGGWGTFTIACCDVFGNTGGPGMVAPQIGTNGNFAEDPLFCCPLQGDYHLQAASPCVSGYGCGLIGALGVGCESPSRVEGVTWGEVKARYRED